MLNHFELYGRVRRQAERPLRGTFPTVWFGVFYRQLPSGADVRRANLNGRLWSTAADSFAEATAHDTPVSAFRRVGLMDRNGSNVLSTRTFIRADPLQGKLPRINPLLNMPFTSYSVRQVF